MLRGNFIHWGSPGPGTYLIVTRVSTPLVPEHDSGPLPSPWTFGTSIVLPLQHRIWNPFLGWDVSVLTYCTGQSSVETRILFRINNGILDGFRYYWENWNNLYWAFMNYILNHRTGCHLFCAPSMMQKHLLPWKLLATEPRCYSLTRSPMVRKLPLLQSVHTGTSNGCLLAIESHKPSQVPGTLLKTRCFTMQTWSKTSENMAQSNFLTSFQLPNLEQIGDWPNKILSKLQEVLYVIFIFCRTGRDSRR